MPNQLEALRKAAGCLDDYRRELEARLAGLNYWTGVQQVAVELINKFPEDYAPSEGFHSPEVSVQFTLDSGTHQALIISKDCREISEIAEPLRFLRERLGPYTISEDPDLNRRIYTFNRDGKKVIFQCFFWNHKDQLCRYVQVGTKEVPVYKLKCGEEEVAAE